MNLLFMCGRKPYWRQPCQLHCRIGVEYRALPISIPLLLPDEPRFLGEKWSDCLLRIGFASWLKYTYKAKSFSVISLCEKIYKLYLESVQGVPFGGVFCLTIIGCGLRFPPANRGSSLRCYGVHSQSTEVGFLFGLWIIYMHTGLGRYPEHRPRNISVP